MLIEVIALALVVILVLLLLIEVAIVADSVASSADVAKSKLPTTVLIEVIAAALTEVKALTPATTVLIDVIALVFVVILVLLLSIDVAIVADNAARVADIATLSPPITKDVALTTPKV